MAKFLLPPTYSHDQHIYMDYIMRFTAAFLLCQAGPRVKITEARLR